MIPACFRDGLGSHVVAASINNECISLYSERNWESGTERLEELSKQSTMGEKIQRRILGNAFKIEIDKMGRVLIPENLRGAAKITQDVIVAGVNKKLEVWDAGLWQKFMSDSEELVPEINKLIPGL